MSKEKEQALDLIEDITGKIQSQIRTGLRDFGEKTVQAIQIERGPAALITKNPEVKVETVRFDSRPIPPQVGVPVPPSPANALSTLDDIIVTINGTAYYTNIYTDGRLDAV